MASTTDNDQRIFSTVLATRGNDDRPSDLEFLLRSYCHKVRIVEHLYGHAHLLIPKMGGRGTMTARGSLAIRLYEEQDMMMMMIDDSRQAKETLQNFCHSFATSLVVFILPPTSSKQIRQQQMDDSNSLFHFAQKAARQEYSPSPIHGRNTVESSNSKTSVSGANGNAKPRERNTRVCLVSTAEAALSMLLAMVDDVQKQEARTAYFERQSHRFLLPNANGFIPETCRETAAGHVAEALRSWANRFELPPGEIEVIMSVLGNLQTIAMADPNRLAVLPVEDRTKRLLHAFFVGQKEELADADHSPTTTVTDYKWEPATETTPPLEQQPVPSSYPAIAGFQTPYEAIPVTQYDDPNLHQPAAQFSSGHYLQGGNHGNHALSLLQEPFAGTYPPITVDRSVPQVQNYHGMRGMREGPVHHVPLSSGDYQQPSLPPRIIQNPYGPSYASQLRYHHPAQQNNPGMFRDGRQYNPGYRD